MSKLFLKFASESDIIKYEKIKAKRYPLEPTYGEKNISQENKRI